MTNDPNPTVSVIIPARNEEASLAACLHSLIAQTGIDYEIIVIDDDSTDRTAEIARLFVVAPGTPGYVASALGATGSAPNGMSTDGKGTKGERTTGQITTAQDTTGTSTTGKGTTSSRAENRYHIVNGTAESRALPVPEARGADAAPRRTRSSTAHVAADVHVRVIPAPPLPTTWTGKNNAMAAGAKIAEGKWLLFTDADSVHKPGSLARAVAEAEQRGVGMLSYSPEQEVRSFWERAVMPVIFAELAATYPPQAVSDPASPMAAANGQYLLISRQAYDAVGGHAAIANHLLEDVAMARLIKSSGRKIFFRYGGDAVRTRMYRSWEQMKEGWTKNLALLFPRPLALAFLRAAEFVLILANVIIAMWAGVSGRSNLALQAALLTMILAGWFWMRIRKAHFSAGSNLAAVIGLPLFAALLLRSVRSHRLKSVAWKGREYCGMPKYRP